MTEATIIYYTSNKEKPDFEQRVRDNILAVCGGLPIVSVSHKPINFGANFCVGEVPVSGFSMFRQVQIACKIAKTRFVISAEADCLYPPSYFAWVPERDDLCYRDTNLWVMPTYRSFYWRKPEGATHAQVIGREFYLARLDELFKGAPLWSVEERNFPKERGLGEDVFPPSQIAYYETAEPVVQIKTSDSMRHYTHSERVDTPSLHYWGDGRQTRDWFLKGIR